MITVRLLVLGSLKTGQSNHSMIRTVNNSKILGFNCNCFPSILVIGLIDFGLNSLFLSCNLIGQFCLSDPGNSSCTVRGTKFDIAETAW